MSIEDIINNIMMVISIMYVVFHRPWIRDHPLPRIADEQPRSNWMPKTSKHPLIELDKELQEVQELERMWLNDATKKAIP